jgi:hypothetical protein
MPPLRIYLGTGVIAWTTLAFQVVLTRLFSAIVPYHFTFLAVSLAMLGTGAGALVVYTRPAWRQRHIDNRVLATLCITLALALLAVTPVLSRLDFGFNEFDRAFFVQLTAAVGIAAVPSLLAGIVVALVIHRHVAVIGRLYAFDLAGASLGALSVVPLLNAIAAPRLLIVLASVAVLGGLLFGWERAPTRRLALAALAACAGTFAISPRTALFDLPHGYQLRPSTVVHAVEWNALARVYGFSWPESDNLAAVFYDRVYAPVPIVDEENPPNWLSLGTGPQSIGYELVEPGAALIIGGGGGRDIYTALSEGERRVDVIELNPAIRRIVDGPLGHLSKRPYSRDHVSTTIGDGRSVLASRPNRYQQIHIGFTDTLTANAAQGFALVENSLYTKEAFHLYFDHLAPGGVLNISRPMFLVGEEALRVAILTLAVLEERGIERPLDHVIVIKGRDILEGYNGTMLARLTPFSDAELGRVAALARERGEGVVLSRNGGTEEPWRSLARAPSLRAFWEHYPLDVSPSTDDRPFFFSMRRLGVPPPPRDTAAYAIDPLTTLLTTGFVLLLLAGLTLGLPFLRIRDVSPIAGPEAVYFAAIGTGFMILEITLIQRFVLFLGYPTYSLSVVLFALLVFTGLGSFAFGKLPDRRSAIVPVLAVIVLLIAIGAFTLQPLLRQLIDLPLSLRIGVTILLLAPIGLLLGVAMPAGLMHAEATRSDAVPYAWAINGMASVVASVSGVAIALFFGFAVASLVAALCYGGALCAAFAWSED